MDGYSMAEAARQLGVSRQTLYKHVNRDAKLYTDTVNGQQRVTLYGMELLQKIIQANKKEPVTTVDKPLTPVDKRERNHLVRELREQVTTLEKSVNDLQAKLTEAQINLAKMEGALQVKDADYQRAMETLSRPGVITAWVRRLFAGKPQDVVGGK